MNANDKEITDKKTLEQEMGKTIQTADLSIINEDILEFDLDFFLEEGILKDVPVIRAVMAVYKFEKNIQTAINKEAWEKKITKEGHLILTLGFSFN